MAYRVNWHDAERTILHVVTEGKTSWEEYHAKYDEALALVRAAGTRIDIIMVADDGPPPGNPLPHQRTLIAQWNGVENLGLVMMVSTNRIKSFVRTTADIAGRMEGSSLIDRVAFVDTVADAMAAS